MADLIFKREHTLGLEGARERVQKLATEMTDSFRVKSEWQGDVLQFRRSGVNGELRVTETTIELDARLGPLLSAFKPKIQAQLDQNFDAWFT